MGTLTVTKDSDALSGSALFAKKVKRHLYEVKGLRCLNI